MSLTADYIRKFHGLMMGERYMSGYTRTNYRIELIASAKKLGLDLNIDDAMKELDQIYIWDPDPEPEDFGPYCP